MKKIYVVLIPLFLFNCISTQPQQNREGRRPFDTAEYKFVKLNGNCEISGEIIVPQRNGADEPCSGCVITLNPATSYSEEFYIKTVQNGIPIEEADLRVLKYIRRAVADDSGNFAFKNIAKGKYYLYSPITYEIRKPTGGYTKTNGYVYKTVYIREKQKVEIVLKKN
ncbi:hypothetical protein H8E88_32970 [candidate division KSB1 bacterium]|nr:hypothetical protein [candidate division KSB1 bacterium]MBL7094361.1 hypothetical protein [candidate division KSB1 bacterium]